MESYALGPLWKKFESSLTTHRENYQINRANGCLVVVPGTHKGQVLPHSYPEWEVISWNSTIAEKLFRAA